MKLGDVEEALKAIDALELEIAHHVRAIHHCSRFIAICSHVSISLKTVMYASSIMIPTALILGLWWQASFMPSLYFCTLWLVSYILFNKTVEYGFTLIRKGELHTNRAFYLTGMLDYHLTKLRHL